jgi:peptidoglycan/xylan/chitin deacetylase (PgdA/CDA1 family)
VSVDLDEIGEYRGLHGLPYRTRGHDAVYGIALDRIVAFARRARIPVSFFAVGRDLERSENAERARSLHDAGHRIENHSFDHRYDLTRLDEQSIRQQIARGQAIIERVTGRVPAGFRAPGYLLNDSVLDALDKEGLAFDSSVFPCAPYYLAKLGALSWLRLRGRRSRSVLGDPRVMMAPRDPYRPGRWHRPGSRSLMELPISVTRIGRLPFIGTSVTMAGALGARWLARGCVGAPLVNLELHGIDFLDAEDALEDLASEQPGLRRPAVEKQDAIAAAVQVLREADYRFVTLEDAAKAFA